MESKKVSSNEVSSANIRSFDTKIGSSTVDTNSNLRSMYKVIVVGDRKVGKTSLINAFLKAD